MQEEINWKEVAGQLRHPQGQPGIETGKRMEQTNANMIQRTIDLLAISDNEKVLEIGFGNGSHVSYLLAKAFSVHYTGIDISETMLQEALAANTAAVSQRKAFFILSNGNTIPFADNTFNKIFTVNTIYFWKSLQEYTTEICRVLKPGGRCCIAFASKDSIEKLPFVQYGFRLLDAGTAENLLKDAGMIMEQTVEEEEIVKSNAGETLTRRFIIVSATKHFGHSDAQLLY
ncbi:MAG: class I SAM-dependent methyltransferase [Chitinophagaceae bacterium]|nr:class I SAM-dependent methyltransferase [Chitinophagaceae bacterium]